VTHIKAMIENIKNERLTEDYDDDEGANKSS
jgi:hypothetical protein